METYLISLAVALIGGLMLSRLTKRIHLPAVTAYLVAGLLLGPFCLGALQLPGFGFNAQGQVEDLSLITQIALGFIAFAMGNEFRLAQLKKIGKSATVIGVFQMGTSAGALSTDLMLRNVPLTSNSAGLKGTFVIFVFSLMINIFKSRPIKNTTNNV